MHRYFQKTVGIISLLLFASSCSKDENYTNRGYVISQSQVDNEMEETPSNDLGRSDE